MIRLFAVNISPLKDERCFRKCYLRSTEERQMQADILKMPEDKARCIAAGLLLENAYKKFRTEKLKELANANSFEYTQKPEDAEGLPEKLPKVRAGLGGKPEFVFSEGMTPEVYFNLSHSGDYVICAMADFEVGADVQRRTGVRESLLRRFFSAEEKKRVELCPEEEEKEKIFAAIWAVKEAEAKLTGRGIGQLLGRMLKGNDEEASGEEIYGVWQGELDEAYAWAVAGYREEVLCEPNTLRPVMVDEGEVFYEGTV